MQARLSGPIGGVTFGSGAPLTTDCWSITRPHWCGNSASDEDSVAFRIRMQFPPDCTRLFAPCLRVFYRAIAKGLPLMDDLASANTKCCILLSPMGTKRMMLNHFEDFASSKLNCLSSLSYGWPSTSTYG